MLCYIYIYIKLILIMIFIIMNSKMNIFKKENRYLEYNMNIK